MQLAALPYSETQAIELQGHLCSSRQNTVLQLCLVHNIQVAVEIDGLPARNGSSFAGHIERQNNLLVIVKLHLPKHTESFPLEAYLISCLCNKHNHRAPDRAGICTQSSRRRLSSSSFHTLPPASLDLSVYGRAIARSVTYFTFPPHSFPSFALSQQFPLVSGACYVPCLFLVLLVCACAMRKTQIPGETGAEKWR
jgi:hypothetical protein